MASNFAIRHAAHIVNSGGIIAYPTDTIYGLGCDPYNKGAVERINAIKQRPLNKQFILLAANIDQIKPFVQIKKEQEAVIAKSTQPTSWIIEASPSAPPWLIGSSKTLSIRISKHDEVQRLCNALGYPIISTSANLSGKKSAKNALELHQYFHHYVEKILIANKKQDNKASKIIRLCDNHIIRN